MEKVTNRMCSLSGHRVPLSSARKVLPAENTSDSHLSSPVHESGGSFALFLCHVLDEDGWKVEQSCTRGSFDS